MDGELERAWCFKEVTGSFGVGLWKALRLLWELVSSNYLFQSGKWKEDQFLERYML